MVSCYGSKTLLRSSFLELSFLDSFPLCCTPVRTPEGVSLVWCAGFVRPADFADPLVGRGKKEVVAVCLAEL